MNIQKAIKQSLKTKKIMVREEMKEYVGFIPTNDVLKGIMVVDLKRKRLPGKFWQPLAEDLIADDWIVTDKDFPKV